MAHGDRHPWPRAPGFPIGHPRHPDDVDARARFAAPAFQHRAFTERWDEDDTMLYNAWLSVKIEPTQFMDRQFLEHLGLYEQVERLWVSMGMGSLGMEPYPLYPDLVCQFMASLRVLHRGHQNTSAAAGEIYFKLHGRRYRMTMAELADLYGLDGQSDLCSYSDTFTDARALFQLISDEVYDSGYNRNMHVRHPALRYVLKLLGTTIFCKMEVNRLRTHELLFLYFGLSPEAFPGVARQEEVRPHLGAVFAQYLLTLQGRPFGSRAPVERIGSLLTPIFRWCGEDELATDGIADISLLGKQHFVSGHALTAKDVWKFRVDGVQRTIQLPRQDLTGIDTSEQLAFRLVDAPAHAPARRRGRARHASSRSPAAASSSAAPPSSAGPSDGPPDFGLRDSPSPDYDDPISVRRFEVRSTRRIGRSWRLFSRWFCSGQQD